MYNQQLLNENFIMIL